MDPYFGSLQVYIRQRREEMGAVAAENCRRMNLHRRVMAFNEVISIMQQRGEGCGIPLKQLQIEVIDPDRDLG